MAKKRIKIRNQGPVTPSLNPKMGGREEGKVIGKKAKAAAKTKPKAKIIRGGKKKKALQVEAYCVKCKTKRIMKDPVATTMKNDKPATKGTCPECGCGMFRIGAAL